MQVDCFIGSSHNRPNIEQQTYSFLKSEGFSPRFIERSEPRRVAECRLRTKTDLFILCEEDVKVEKGALQQAIALMQQNPSYTQLGLSEGSVMGLPVDIVETRYITGCAIIKKTGEEKIGLATNIIFERVQ